MGRLGQPNTVYVNIQTEVVGEFSNVLRRTRNTPATPCVEDGDFSFTRCIMDFVARTVGCHLDWVETYKFPQHPPCETRDQLDRYSHQLERMMDYSWPRLTRETGCYGMCQHKEYKFNKVTHISHIFPYTSYRRF